jgi:transposase
MRYELNDDEWSIIKPMLPNKPRGVPRVDDRRASTASFGSCDQVRRGDLPKGLLVPTGDNVREPQNRRVEIVIQ